MIVNFTAPWKARSRGNKLKSISPNVQVKRSRAEGPICRSEPGRAHILFLPVRDPDKASGGRGAQRRCV